MNHGAINGALKVYLLINESQYEGIEEFNTVTYFYFKYVYGVSNLHLFVLRQIT